MSEDGRFTVNLGKEVRDFLDRYCARKGITMTQATRRAIRRLEMIDARLDNGARLFIEEDGVMHEIVFVE